VLATLLIALGFNPVRVRLQRFVDRALFGDRADPVRAVARLGARLGSGPQADPVDGLTVVREALRLPYAALLTNGVERAAHGTPPELLETVPLDYRGERVGELVVGVRSGQRRLSAADRRMLELLAVPLALAVHATALSEAVQRSRESIVAAREEERRLRRDLHDGLGPVLTGVAFQADAARNLIRADPARADALLGELRGPPKRSRTSAGWSTSCAHRPWTSSAWWQRCIVRPSNSEATGRRSVLSRLSSRHCRQPSR
jgi:two-component system NarL family sensor kinase